MLLKIRGPHVAAQTLQQRTALREDTPPPRLLKLAPLAMDPTMTPETTLKALCSLTCPAGGVHPPRRATLRKGLVAPRLTEADHEVEVISRICELARLAAGMPIFPRDTGALMRMCLETNAPGAWDALRTDILLGDADQAVIAKVLEEGYAVSALVVSMVSGNRAAVQDVIACVGTFLRIMSPTAKKEFARVLGFNLLPFIETFWKSTHIMRRNDRENAIADLGRLLGECDMPPETLGDQLLLVLQNKRDDFAQLFVYAPMDAMLAARPQLLTAVMDRVNFVAPANRYPLLSALVRLLNTPAGATARVQCRAYLDQLAESTLRGCMLGGGALEPRIALVCAMLIVPDAAAAAAAAGDADAANASKKLERALAKALECLAAAFITTEHAA